jgi:isopenicillin-N epimerase
MTRDSSSMVSQTLSINWKKFWTLDPAITFLNHGSFGACPLPVLERQQALRSQLESEPVRFFASELEPLLDEARQVLASFVGAELDNLAFVPNATTGVNTVLRSLHFHPDDELLTTDHEYNASRNALNVAAHRAGVKVVVAQVPFPLESPDQVIAAVMEKVTPRTRLVLLDHVVSQTALVFPIADLIQQLSERGIETLIDGAHAPGMMPLNLSRLGATYYTGNCHKWVCAPKGAAFLYVHPDRLSTVRPLVISHGANSPRTDRSLFHLEFDWTGTGDPTPYLCVPEAIRFMESLLPGGWDEIMACNHRMAIAARQLLCNTLNAEPPCPEEMLGSMAVIPLSNGLAEPLQHALFHRFHIEVPIVPWHGTPNRLVRVSAQLYNTMADYDELAHALVKLLADPTHQGA